MSGEETEAHAYALLGANSHHQHALERRIVRRVIYDFTPAPGEAMLSLRAGDLVEIQSDSDASGWASGWKFDPVRLEAIDESGWFPSAYLGDVVDV